MKVTLRFVITALIILCFGYKGKSQLKLPSLISDGMVLQRNVPLKFWGWDMPDTEVSLEINGREAKTITNNDGKWEVVLQSMAAGGPYKMVVKGSTLITVSDILIGEVWVCSGQSNMELNMNRASPLYEREIAESENDFIRYFSAPQTYDFNLRHDDYQGGKWQKANPQTVLNFGALAYFFARELNALYKVPVGMINTAIGGTPTEAWISEEAIKSFPEHYSELQRFKNQSLIDSIEKQNREKSLSWYSQAGKTDKGHLDPDQKWMLPDIKTASWDAMDIPGYWANTGIGHVNGILWFRKVIDVPSSMEQKPAKLFLGRIIDADSVFVNGKFVATTSYQYPPRRYNIPAGILKEGENTIVVKVISNGGKGGFVPGKPYYIAVGEDTIDLKGEWLFKIGSKMSPAPGSITVKYKPTGLFNAMIAPLLQYRIKGVLWYQGESNTGRAEEQKLLFPALIRDWRNNWHQGDFPFLYVQLPNYMETKDEPSESSWALFREAQCDALSLPATAMAVTIDIGEWNDIHPLNKLDIARRLFRAAQNKAYGEKVVYSGPVFQSMKIRKNKIVLNFTDQGKGLVIHGEKLNEFAIAGPDRKFVWANAEVKKNKIIVWNDKISNPVAVRYAWADNPVKANLYNAEGLPASPFRTDKW